MLTLYHLHLPPPSPGKCKLQEDRSCIPYSTQHRAHPLGSAQLKSVGECAQNLNKAILILLHSVLFLTSEYLLLWSLLPGVGAWFPHHYTWLPKNIVVNQQIFD